MTVHAALRVLLAGALGLTGASPALGPISQVSAAVEQSACLDATKPLTAEEKFLNRPEAARLISGGGFDELLRRFTTDICRTTNPAAATRITTAASRELWRRAVDRAQGRIAAGALSAGDDRPLYWTRLSMTAHLRRWAPAIPLEDTKREALIAAVDRIGRGQADLAFPRTPGTKKVLVTGFDPFMLWNDIRQANPSGASALALDGQTLQTPTGPVRIEAAIFPVRWRDFSDGMVENALLPHLKTQRNQIDLWMTTSQGREGRIDLERYNGAWRGGFPDNEDACYRGMAPIASGLPTMRPQPQWTWSTLPIDRMIAAKTGPFPVYDHTEVVELPGKTPAEPVTKNCPAPPSTGATRPKGPTPGSIARSGAGGDYLSNEIAYRATLLRDALGLELPGGHLHTPILDGLSDTDRDELSNPTFEANRTAITAQIRALVLAAAEASGQGASKRTR